MLISNMARLLNTTSLSSSTSNPLAPKAILNQILINTIDEPAHNLLP